MKVRLLRATRIVMPAGEIVEVPEVTANFLVETRSAEFVMVEPSNEKTATTNTKKTQKGKGK